MNYRDEIQRGERFAFGKNWQRFHAVLSEARIHQAERSLCDFLRLSTLEGKRFLDVGSGSGLFSLAARRLGARVHSFDYDSESVECTRALRERYYPGDQKWTVEQGSVLDRTYLASCGMFDVCYAWGVLHHTGHLWLALYNVHLTVADDGWLYIGIYNDQGVISQGWEIVKRAYCAGTTGKVLLTPAFYTLFFLAGLCIDLATWRNPMRRYREHKNNRGMSLLHDWRDWLGGYPYEPATPQKIIAFYANLGYKLQNFSPTGHGFGNNQFLFQKTPAQRLELRAEVA